MFLVITFCCLLLYRVYPSTPMQIHSLFCAMYRIVMFSIISFCCSLNFSLKTINSPIALLHAPFSALVGISVNCKPSLSNQFFYHGHLLFIIDIICFCLEYVCYLHFKIQQFHIPIWYLLVKCWLTQHWSSLSWSVMIFWTSSSGMSFGWCVCLPHCLHCHCSCMSCHLPDSCLHIFRICHFSLT